MGAIVTWLTDSGLVDGCVVAVKEGDARSFPHDSVGDEVKIGKSVSKFSRF